MELLRDTAALLPICVVLLTALFVLLADVFSAAPDGSNEGGSEGPERRWLASLSVVGLLLALALVARSFVGLSAPRQLFGGSMSLDRFGLFVQGLVLAGATISCLLAAQYLESKNRARGEFYALLLFGVVGLMVMASSSDWIVIFIGLETMSVSVYALAGYSRGNDRSAEAALKYFLLGAFASGLLLYGIALIWGVTGSTNMKAIGAVLNGSPALADDPLVYIAALLLFVGVGFKVALVPFHMWTPDVYEGAPTPATAFMAATVKAGAFAVLLRMLAEAFFQRDLALSPGAMNAPVGWFQLCVWTGILTMTVGNVMAVLQSNVKRMLAYSSVAHAGYAMIAVAALVPLQGGQPAAAGAAGAVLYYLTAYAAATVGAFGVLALLQDEGEDLVDIRELHGFASRQPWLALVFVLFLLSLAGLPPTGGFIAKLQVFGVALTAGDAFYASGSAIATGHSVMYWLVVIGALNSVVGVYYYLRPVVAMYMKPRRREWRPLSGSFVTLALALCALVTLWLGLLPQDMVELTRSAMQGLGSLAP